MSSEAARLLGLLAEPDRLKVATGLEPKAVEQALARLTSGGLVA